VIGHCRSGWIIEWLPEHPSWSIVGVEVADTREESSMIRPILAAGIVALALAVTPTVAQQTAPQTPPPDQPTAQKVDPSIVGLSVYSSDGQKLGQVSEVGTSAGEPAIRADMGEFLGINPGSVIIGGQAFEKKADRIEIAMTAQEIKDTITRQKDQREQPEPGKTQ
jgi:hypothetical protein